MRAVARGARLLFLGGAATRRARNGAAGRLVVPHNMPAAVNVEGDARMVTVNRQEGEKKGGAKQTKYKRTVSAQRLRTTTTAKSAGGGASAKRRIIIRVWWWWVGGVVSVFCSALFSLSRGGTHTTTHWAVRRTCKAGARLIKNHTRGRAGGTGGRPQKVGGL